MFAPDRGKHATEMGNRRTDKQSDAFVTELPQNILPVSGPGLSSNGCHRDSDRVDVDGLPKVGAAVWPHQVFANIVCPPAQKTFGKAASFSFQSLYWIFLKHDV